jgi:prophage antirepressor-like protein
MSELQLYPFDFHGSTVHTLTLDDRPAWIAREIGEALGYARDGKRLVNKIKGEWSEDFLPHHDFELVVGEQLALVKAQVPSVSPSAKGLIVLFESGLHLVLVKSHMPLGRQLRRFLVDDVLPQVARTGAYAPGPKRLSPLEIAVLHEVRLAARVELDDRKFRASQLRDTATALLERGRLDVDAWCHAVTLACEIALDEPFPTLKDASRGDWVEAQALADTHGWGLPRVLGAATSLDLLHRPELAQPLPVNGANGWTVTFRLSPTAALQIEAWIDEQPELVRLEPTGDRAA